MAVPSYSSDLVDISLAATADTWVELGSATAGGVPASETDYFIEGTGCQSKSYNATGLGSMGYDRGSAATIATGNASFHWLYWGCPNTIGTLASGGYRLAIGSATTAYKMWYVAGSDTYTYGGWINCVVDPTIAADATIGAPGTGTWVFGSAVLNNAVVSKGNPYGNDAIRTGRTIKCMGGAIGSGYCTFSDAATTNDNISNRWGLFQAISGGYLQKGLFLIGSSTTSAHFVDSNKNIVIQDTTKVSSSFNEFEVRNASSIVDWTGIQLSALGTVSKGKFTTTDNADINFDTCIFNDMDTFVFQSNATVLTTTFRRCGQVTQGGGVFTTCRFDSSPATASLLVSNPSNISYCTFISDGSNHAIQINTAGNYAFDGNNFSNYAVIDGVGGNEVIYNTSGGNVVLNVTTSGTGTISIRNDGASTTSVVTSSTLTVTVKNENNDVIPGAQVVITKITPTNYTSDAGNASGDVDLVVNEAVDTDTPQTGTMTVWDKSANKLVNYRYASWATKTFTLLSGVTGTASGSTSTTLIHKTGTGFTTANIQEGDTIRNTTDGSWAVVDEIVDADTITTFDALVGGADNTWQEDDTYLFHTLAFALADNDDAVRVPIMNQQTNASGIATKPYTGAATSVRIDVRKSSEATKYQQYTTTGEITASGLNATVVMIEDTIA